jgi:DNA-directed RNA polymerase sigma subunit (sigma70/sigma32)
MAKKKTGKQKLDLRSLLAADIQQAEQELRNLLTPSKEQVIRLRYGSRDDDASNKESSEGEVLQPGITRESIRQAEARSLRDLRDPERARKARIRLAQGEELPNERP